jgi:hypothetical protein
MLFRVAIGAVLVFGAIGGWVIAGGPSFMAQAMKDGYVTATESGGGEAMNCATFDANGRLTQCSPEVYEKTRQRLEEAGVSLDDLSDSDSSSDEVAEEPPLDQSSSDE